MKKIILAACLAGMAFTLSACSLVGIPDSPRQAADQTMLDEQALTGIELAYKAARLAVETGVDAGLVKGQNAARFAELDDKAYTAVKAARAAYAAGNASGYLEALSSARAAVTDLLSLVPAKEQ